jgi:hypothetical protein
VTEIPTAEEHAALSELTKSLGWQVFCGLIEREFGPDAQVRRIGQAVNAMPPQDIDGHNAVVAQILAASRAAYSALTLPGYRLKQLDVGEKTAKQQAEAKPDLFAMFRRGPRTAA